MSSALLIPSIPAQQHYSEIKFVENIKGKDVNFCVLKEVENVPKLDQVTSVAVIPFIQQDTIITTVLRRGLDIPGGHVEASDNGVADTARREAYEEARISLADPLYLIGIISSDYMGTTPELTTYMLITVARVETVDDFISEFESTGREMITTTKFLEQYVAGSHTMMSEVIQRAKSLNDELFPQAI